MKREKQLELLSRWRDGELPPNERARVEAARAALGGEAEQAWEALGEHLRAQPVPAPTPEAMWNDVRRAIRVAQAEPAVAVGAGGRWNWAVAALAVLFMVGVGLFGVRIWLAPSAEAAMPRVEWVEAELPGSSAMVYEDEASGAVVIWLMTPDEGPSGEEQL
ncbi:MAG: hypothetical protein H3C50_10185 [Kiritimatiellae bacterium]|nr:hypothetical protein [Kiritimatiellia bacterium]MCO5069047.1 hypothetical protein [Kiritimatiellia bacterium]